MTTFYPSQPTPQFLKKYTRNVYNRVQHNAHHDSNGQQLSDETPLSLQVSLKISLVIQSFENGKRKKIPVKNSRRKKDACKNKHFC